MRLGRIRLIVMALILWLVRRDIRLCLWIATCRTGCLWRRGRLFFVARQVILLM